MIFGLKVLNEDATLNNFVYASAISIAKGADAKLVLQLHQVDKKIRYIPATGATITADFKKSDNTSLTKTATHPFVDDRSIIQFVLTDLETANLVSQNLVVKIDESSNISYAILSSGLQMVPLTSGC